jgi:hypothetical protein
LLCSTVFLMRFFARRRRAGQVGEMSTKPLHLAALRTVGDFFLAVSASLLVLVAAIVLSLWVRMVLMFLVESLPPPIGGIVVLGGFVWMCVWAFTRKSD